MYYVSRRQSSPCFYSLSSSPNWTSYVPVSCPVPYDNLPSFQPGTGTANTSPTAPSDQTKQRGTPVRNPRQHFPPRPGFPRKGIERQTKPPKWLNLNPEEYISPPATITLKNALAQTPGSLLPRKEFHPPHLHLGFSTTPDLSGGCGRERERGTAKKLGSPPSFHLTYPVRLS